MNTDKTAARIVGVLMLTATATFMLGSGILESILTTPDYLATVYQNQDQVIIGVLLEYVDAIAVVGIGVVIFSVLKRHSETIALGYASTRIIEAAILIVSGISLLSLIPLSQEYVEMGAPDASYFQTIGDSFVSGSNMAFQIAMIVLAVGSLPFCYLLFRSNLVPKAISVLGFIGYIALLASGLMEISGYSIGMILFLPGALFEVIFPIWLIVKGFNSSAGTVKPQSA